MTLHTKKFNRDVQCNIYRIPQIIGHLDVRLKLHELVCFMSSDFVYSVVSIEKKNCCLCIAESPCSSDDVPSSSTEQFPSTSHSVTTNFNNSSYVQCTDNKLSSSDDDDIDFNTTNNAVPVPSTSTGITSNGHLFRLAQSHADSDDDPSPENSPRAIPVPINGSHHSLNNYSSGIDDERPNRYHSSRRRKTNISLNRNQNNFGHYSSHSNSRLSSSCSEDDDASSNDSLLPFFDNKKRKMSTNGNVEVDVVADENELSTTTNQSWMNFTPDSGISVVGGGGSSSSRCTSSAPPSTSRHDGNNNANGLRNNGGDSSMKLFQQKVARVRRNYRNNFGDDSDSD